jgi:hypothetical protein
MGNRCVGVTPFNAACLARLYVAPDFMSRPGVMSGWSAKTRRESEIFTRSRFNLIVKGRLSTLRCNFALVLPGEAASAAIPATAVISVKGLSYARIR